ncbi:hypothetical protein LBMAG42_11280 [Deltaproteobacteria bacterium]|nr:hypothetical protein LBMAG42_11280 [Deltaproteobacteria bacterium]
MPDPAVVAYDPDLVSTLDEQHHHIRQVVYALQATDDVRLAAVLLRQLESLLRPHFVEEQRPGGMLDSMAATAVAQDRVVASIVREHREITLATEAALADTQSCLDGPVADTLRRARAVCDAVLEHQRREGDAFLDAIYAEPGGP